jgi:predicted Fe-S protein YdhL (DUF1289 family)
MNCGSCSAICQTNNTGICLGCQRGFVNVPQEDAWVNSKEREKVKLQERKLEIENALKKPRPKKVPMGKRPKASEGIRRSHQKREEAAQES